jgi:asparagine synthase (glutamine-hydrolysing)
MGRVDASVIEALKRADSAQVHRGPDDAGFWSDGARRVALAHRRLSIIDLSALGHQPMVDDRTGCVLVFNGEVYNFRELREELTQRGHAFASRTDTEVVLAAFVEWGTACFERFRGMFAIGVWDPRDRTLTLARDRLGIKPLYVFETNVDGEKTVLFASELRALLASGYVDRTIDPTALASYLWNGFVFGPNTIIRNVRLLEAGTTVRFSVDEGELGTPRPFWSLPRRSSGVPTSVASMESSLASAVRERLIADVPVGIFLSGGIDSSAVAAMAARAAPGNVHTFNIGFDEEEFDESHHARAVARALGTEHREIRLREQQFREQLPDAFGAIDQPTFDALNTYMVSRAVREAGITVALAGTGGDELFGGYSTFVDLPAARPVAQRLRRVPEFVLRAAASAAVRVKMGRYGSLPPQTRWGKLGDVLSTRGDLAELYQASYCLFTRSTQRRLMPDVEHAGCRSGIPEDRWDGFRASIDGVEELEAVSKLELQAYITERLLRDTDASSMAVSLEVRVPLLDHQFVEAVMSADPAVRFTPIRTKMLLRHLALRDLDPSLFDRPKSGFVMPFERWCRAGLREDVESVIRDRRLCQSVGLDPDMVASVFESVMARAPGFYWSRLWALYVLLRWCQTHAVRR